MRAIYQFFRFARKEPFGCFVSSTISFVLISCLLAGAVYVSYSMLAVSLIKGAIVSSTGFSVSAQYIYVNAFTGECQIDGLTLINPSAYEFGLYRVKRPDNIEKFMEVKKIQMRLNPLKLLQGRVEISSMSADISFLNCVRISNSTYNLSEFLLRIGNAVSIANEYNKPFLKNLDLRVNRAVYTDYSTDSNSIVWSTSNLTFHRTDIEDFTKLIDDMREYLEASNARFISTALSVLKIDNL